MLTRIFPKTHRRYVESPVGCWLEGFADWLVSVGYARSPTCHHVRRLKLVLERVESIAPDAYFSVHQLDTIFTSVRTRPRYRATRRAFERFLATRGLLTVEPDVDRFALLLKVYRHHLIEVRGLAPPTVSQHISTIADFLTQSVPQEAVLLDLSAPAVEQFVITKGQLIKRQSLQHSIARLRAFLRYCFDHGHIRERLYTIDTPRTYRGEAPPRALAWRLVQQLLQSVDRNSKAGWRDYAILHLMAYYGLRPSEIVALTVASIDWTARTLRVDQRKTSSNLILPLSDQTLRLLKRYLHCGRPGSTRPELFMRVRTPLAPMQHYAVCELYEKRARQSGLPLDGSSSYCLRHAFAMRLLERGVGVKAIGDLLGHRSLESTYVYLRLQTESLRDVALPLPCRHAAQKGDHHVPL